MRDRVVFITGASSGIGEALALECAQRGAAVVVTGRRLDRLEILAERIRLRGHKALALAVDVTDQASLEAGVAAAVEQLGRIDYLVANAGFGVANSFAKLEIEDYRRQFETNVYGVLRTLWAGLEELKRSRGLFVVTGSVAGYASAPGSTPYSMSKFAVRGFVEGIRGELARDGVGVTLITPGFVRSEIRIVDNQGRLKENAKDPLPGYLQMPAEKAARQMAQAMELRRAEVVITVHGKLIVFLARHFPGLTRWLLGKVQRGKNRGLSLASG